jgi:hypothetical protein
VGGRHGGCVGMGRRMGGMMINVYCWIIGEIVGF